MARTLHGTTYTWQLGDAPIGSGDAGEVFTVTCVEQPEITGVLKKPARIATGGTLQRQANQIAQEGLALAQLKGIPQGKAHPPRLLDQAPDFTQGTADFFIVSETARGIALSTLLAISRQTDKPFPRRVIITVLDALFDLFARAHRAGVLWNDVKLEHIYWHAETGGVSVIDWGNAQFLEEGEAASSRALPRWEDYRQMVDTLGGFLQQSAPELHVDLGWAEFKGQSLDAPKISILARRIAYQQQVVALRVMEYQSLVRVVLAGDPSFNGLQKIRDYHQILEQIGAPWHSDEVLAYGQTLVQNSLAVGDTQIALQATALIWVLFGDSLDLSWHLLREYFRQPDILTQPDLSALAQATLSQDWSLTLWLLARIARKLPEITWWDQLVPVVRQKALGLVTPTPYQICTNLVDWCRAQKGDWLSVAASLTVHLEQWRNQGEDLEESPFEYPILQVIGDTPAIPRRIRTELRQSFAAGEEAIRELLQTWVNLNWDTLPQAFRRVLGWDPDRWGVIQQKELVGAFQHWLNELFIGPTSSEPAHSFLEQMENKRPRADHFLGKPPWLRMLLEMLVALQNNAPISDYTASVRTWSPWLLAFETLQDATPLISPSDETTLPDLLQTFIQHLKAWSDPEAGLEIIKVNAPQFYPFCKQLMAGFQGVTSLTTDMKAIASACADPPDPTLDQSCLALQKLLDWRKAITSGDLEIALEALDGPTIHVWRLLNHAREKTIYWKIAVKPALLALLKLEPLPDITDDQISIPEGLVTASDNLVTLSQDWQQSYTFGIDDHLIETIEMTTERIRASFFEWRRNLEHTSDRIEGLLYHCCLVEIRSISDMLLQLAQHSRQARLAHATLSSGDAAPLSTQLHAGETLLAELGVIEALLTPDKSQHRFPEWQATFQQILNANSKKKQIELSQTLSNDHPLSAWLVQ